MNNTTTVFLFQRPSRGCEIQVVKLSSSELAHNCTSSGGECICISGSREGLRQLNILQYPCQSSPALLQDPDY